VGAKQKSAAKGQSEIRREVNPEWVQESKAAVYADGNWLTFWRPKHSELEQTIAWLREMETLCKAAAWSMKIDVITAVPTGCQQSQRWLDHPSIHHSFV